MNQSHTFITSPKSWRGDQPPAGKYNPFTDPIIINSIQALINRVSESLTAGRYLRDDLIAQWCVAMRAFVIQALLDGWTPAEISARLDAVTQSSIPGISPSKRFFLSGPHHNNSRDAGQ